LKKTGLNFGSALFLLCTRVPIFQLQLGLCLRLDGQPDQALSCFNKALEINPNYEHAMRNRQLLQEAH